MVSARRLVVGVLLGAVTLAVAIDGVDWSTVGSHLAQIQPGYGFFAVAFLVLNFLLRALRWRLLLIPVGRFSTLRHCLGIYMIGYMSNLLLPLRAGEVIRPFLFARRHTVSMLSVFATVLLERLADIQVLLVLAAVAAAYIDLPEKLRWAVWVVAAFAMAMTVLLYRVALASEGGTRSRWSSMLPSWWRARWQQWVSGLRLGLGSLGSIRGNLGLLVVSGVIWISGILFIGCILRSFGIELSWYAPVFVLVVANLGMMVPSAPGFVGVAHLLYVFALEIVGVDRNSAFAFAVTTHGLNFSLVVLFGVGALLAGGMSLRSVYTTGSAQVVPPDQLK